jgi:hypothetical protein
VIRDFYTDRYYEKGELVNWPDDIPLSPHIEPMGKEQGSKAKASAHVEDEAIEKKPAQDDYQSLKARARKKMEQTGKPVDSWSSASLKAYLADE